MSIASAIQNAQNKVAAAYTSCNNMGATMPVTQDLANLPATIDSIPTGGGNYNFTFFSGGVQAATITPTAVQAKATYTIPNALGAVPKYILGIKQGNMSGRTLVHGSFFVNYDSITGQTTFPESGGTTCESGGFAGLAAGKEVAVTFNGTTTISFYFPQYTHPNISYLILLFE